MDTHRLSEYIQEFIKVYNIGHDVLAHPSPFQTDLCKAFCDMAAKVHSHNDEFDYSSVDIQSIVEFQSVFKLWIKTIMYSNLLHYDVALRDDIRKDREFVGSYIAVGDTECPYGGITEKYLNPIYLNSRVFDLAERLDWAWDIGEIEAIAARVLVNVLRRPGLANMKP